ncbi:unnamed protein product, partial [Oppiella nova]
MYQMQSQPVPNQPQQMHHMSVQSQNNYGGPPPNMSFQNQMSMQGMDQSVQMSGPTGHPPPVYQHPQPSQNPMMMRAQMQSQQQMVGQQPSQQFMPQRSQYQTMQAAPNVTMGQMGSMDNRPNSFNQNTNMQSMGNTGGPHMNQWQTSGQRPQQVVSQLQR